MPRRMLVLAAVILIAVYVWDTFFRAVPDQRLAHVPADTPYLIVQTKPMSPALADKLLAYYAASYSRALQALRQTAPTQSPVEAAQLKSLLGVMELFENKFSREGMQSLGLKFGGTGVVYGIGLFPVIRAQIADAAKFDAFVDRLEQKYRVGHVTQQFAGHSYRLIDMGRLVLLMSAHGVDLTAALLPKAAYRDYLGQLFGNQYPLHNLGDGRLFNSLAKQFAFTGRNLGFIDFKRVFEQINDPSSTTRRLLAAAGLPAPKALPQECDPLARYVLGEVPRLVFGVSETSASQMKIGYVLETAADLATGLQGLSAQVPGLGAHPDALAEFGVAMNLDALGRGLRAVTEGLIEHAQGCPLVDAARLRAELPKISLALNPITTSLKGFDLVVDKLQASPGSNKPEVEATLVGAVDDPMPLVALATAANPAWAGLPIQDNGQVVQLPTDKFGPAAPALFVAVDRHALALGLGEGSRGRLASRLKEKGVTPVPFLSLAYRPGKLLDALEPIIQARLAQAKPRQQQIGRNMLANMRREAAFARWIRLTVGPVAHGLAVNYTLKLK